MHRALQNVLATKTPRQEEAQRTYNLWASIHNSRLATCIPTRSLASGYMQRLGS